MEDKIGSQKAVIRMPTRRHLATPVQNGQIRLGALKPPLRSKDHNFTTDHPTRERGTV